MSQSAIHSFRDLPVLAGKILYFLMPIALSWLSISLMSMHMAYYDIGINASANNGFLMFFVFPVLLIIQYAIAIVAPYIAGRFLKSRRTGFVAGGLLLLCTVAGSFVMHLHKYADYPTQIPKDTVSFLKYYLVEIGRHVN